MNILSIIPQERIRGGISIDNFSKMSASPDQLVNGAKLRAEAVPRLLQMPQVEGELVVVDGQSSNILRMTWIKCHARLFDSCLLLYSNKNEDTPISVFMVEDAVIKYDVSDLGTMVMNKTMSTVHKFSLSRPSTGRKLWISTRDSEVRDAWIKALLSTGSASVVQ